MADQFVLMQKDGEKIRVHPDVVDAHKQIGWVVVGETAKVLAADLTPQPPSPHREGGARPLRRSKRPDNP